MQSTVQLIDAPETATAMLHPVRSRLLEQFREPRSAAEVARELGLPRQRIGHHVRLLRDRGLLQEAGERRNDNFVEQLLQATAQVWQLVHRLWSKKKPYCVMGPPHISRSRRAPCRGMYR